MTRVIVCFEKLSGSRFCLYCIYCIYIYIHICDVLLDKPVFFHLLFPNDVFLFRGEFELVRKFQAVVRLSSLGGLFGFDGLTQVPPRDGQMGFGNLGVGGFLILP